MRRKEQKEEKIRKKKEEKKKDVGKFQRQTIQFRSAPTLVAVVVLRMEAAVLLHRALLRRVLLRRVLRPRTSPGSLHLRAAGAPTLPDPIWRKEGREGEKLEKRRKGKGRRDVEK